MNPRDMYATAAVCACSQQPLQRRSPGWRNAAQLAKGHLTGGLMHAITSTGRRSSCHPSLLSPTSPFEGARTIERCFFSSASGTMEVVSARRVVEESPLGPTSLCWCNNVCYSSPQQLSLMCTLSMTLITDVLSVNRHRHLSNQREGGQGF
jgi:hypothetical protein